MVVTGLGVTTALGITVEGFWENIFAGKCGIRLIEKVDVSDYQVKLAGEIDLTDEMKAHFKKQKQFKRLDPYIVYGYVAASQAAADAGIEDSTLVPERCGSLMGTGDGGSNSFVDNVKFVKERGLSSVHPMFITNIIPSTLAGYVAQNWDLRGPCFSVNSACATGNHAIGSAAMMIEVGMADMIMAGSSEAPLCNMGVGGFGNIGALSLSSDPESASRPFEKNRDGFVLSDGAGAVCLEELEHAKKRGAHIYCEISGYGFTCDAHDLVAPQPEARGAMAAIKLALEKAQLSPGDIDLINAHATSTSLGDLAEAKAIHAIFGKYLDDILIHSTKSMLGHSLGGAASIEAVAIMPAITKGIVHPTVNQVERDDEVNLDIVTELTEAKVDHAISNSFGFGGQNAVVVYSKFKG